MIFDGITLVEGSEIRNLVVASGPAFPTAPGSPPDEGEMFYKTTATAGLYIFKNGTWIRFIGENETLVNMLPDQPGLSAGTYRQVTVNLKGLVTSGANPTTLAGYGITDAQPLDEDLTAIANLAGISGVLRKTGINTWVLDTGAYLTGNQTITLTGDASGSGTTSVPVTLVNTGVAAGSYGSASNVGVVGVDAKGRVVSATNTPIQVDTSAVTSGTFANGRISQTSVTQHQAALGINETQILDGALLSRNAGNETISGAWSFLNPVTGVTPTAAGHLVTKSYVDSIAAGVNPHASVKVATTGPITLSGTQTIDGVAVLAGERVLVKDQASQEQNGAYVVASGAWSRASDFDGSPTNEVVAGDLLFVESGTINANTSWVLVTSGTITVGTTPLVFSLFSKAGELDAGAGLSKTGNVLNVGTASASRIVVNADNIDLATTGVVASTYRSVTVDAYGRITGGTNPTTLAGYGITDAAPLGHVGASGGAHAAATTSTAGFMSSADKTKLDSLSPGLGGAIANQQIAFGNGSNIAGASSLTYDSSTFTMVLASGLAFRPTFTIRGADTDRGTNVVIRAGNETSEGLTSTNGGFLGLSGGNSAAGSGYRGGSVVISSGTSGGALSGSDGARFESCIAFNTSADGSNVLTERLRILANGAWSVGSTGTATGTSGQVLTSNGNGSAPSWQSAPAAAAGTLTGSTLASGVTASSLTSVGTLSSLAVTGNITVSTGYTQRSVATGISAAGSTQGTATIINRELNVVSTVASGTGVILPSSIGTTFVVVNAGANALNVFPVSGAAIDTNAANAALALPVGARIMFIQVSAAQYFTLNATYA